MRCSRRFPWFSDHVNSGAVGFCVAARVRFPYEFQVGLGSFEEFTVSSSHGVTRRHGVTSKADKPSPVLLVFDGSVGRDSRDTRSYARDDEVASVAISAQAISCSNEHGVFPVHERFWLCLVQVSTTQFCSFPSFLMARASDGTDVPVSPVPASSSNMGAPDGSLPDLEGTGYRASTMEEKINEMFVHIQMVSSLAARFTTLETNAMSVSSGSDIVMACGFLTTPNIHE